VSGRSLVLVLVEDAPDLDWTVDCAVRIAAQQEAAIHMIHVVRPDAPPDTTADGVDDTELGTRLSSLRKAATQTGVVVRLVTLRGKAESVIPAYAQLRSAQLIIVGRYYGSSSLWRNAAVAGHLSRVSPVPVLVIPPRGSGSNHRQPLPLTRIVAPVDFRVASAAALRLAADLARRHAARLTILHAIENAPAYLMLSGSEASRATRRLAARAVSIGQRLRRSAIRFGAADAEARIVTGDAHRAILEAASEEDAALIVMGAAPRARVDELVFGSTLRAVLRAAKIPVLVLPVAAGAHAWPECSRTRGSVSGQPEDADRAAA
jgi:nucleotide-binding universal stress UspA family protein